MLSCDASLLIPALGADVFTILRWRETGRLFKGGAEAGLGGKAAGVADVLLTEPGGLQKVLCGVHARLDHILMRRVAGFLFEETTEVKRAQRRLTGELLERELLLQVLRDIGDGVVNDATGADIGTVLAPCEQQLGEDIYDVIVQQRIPDGERVAEAEIKLMKILFEAIAVLQGDDRPVLLGDGLVEAAGTCTVEVKPLDLAAVVGTVGVGLIAVEEDDIARIGGALLTFGFDEALSTLDIHEKKAVEGLAADAVARHVVEVPDDHRIEEELVCEGTGGIDVEVRTGLNVLFGR